MTSVVSLTDKGLRDCLNATREGVKTVQLRIRDMEKRYLELEMEINSLRSALSTMNLCHELLTGELQRREHAADPH